MFLHHVMCMGLITYSYLNNGSNIGFCILWVHFPCDITVFSARGFVDLKNELPKTVAFILTLLIWPVTRFYMLGTLIYRGSYFNFKSIALYRENPDFEHNCYILFCLFLMTLHVFWFYKMLQILANLIAGKEAVDITAGRKLEDDKSA